MTDFIRCFIILLGEFITRTYMFEIFLLTTKYVLNTSNRRNYNITIHFRFPTLFILQLHYVVAMFFIRFGKWDGVRHLALKVGKDAEKIRGEMPHFNTSKLFLKLYAYTFQRTKNNVTRIRLPNNYTHNLQTLNKCFLGGGGGFLRVISKKETAASNITRYRMGQLIGYAWSIVAFVGVGVSIFHSRGNYVIFKTCYLSQKTLH